MKKGEMRLLRCLALISKKGSEMIFSFTHAKSLLLIHKSKSQCDY